MPDTTPTSGADLATLAVREYHERLLAMLPEASGLELADAVDALLEDIGHARERGDFQPAPTARFVIAGPTDTDDRVLYWSNADGWGHLSTATIFTAAEAGDGDGPTGLLVGDDARWCKLTGALETVHNAYVQAEQEDGSADELLADAGIPTDYTVDNLCVVCGNDLDGLGGYSDLPGDPYDRPDRVVAVHDDCLERGPVSRERMLEAVDVLVKYAVANAAEAYRDGTNAAKLREWVGGAVLVQVDEPDYEQVDAIELAEGSA